MDLNFIGKGAAFNPEMKNTSAYFTVNSNLFLIDCGESVFGEIWNLPELAECKNIYVLITHLHADHVGSLGSLISYCCYVLKQVVYVIHPLSTIVELLTLLGISKSNYIYLECLPNEIPGISAEAVEVEHAADMCCFGYLLETKDIRLFYSGDAAKIPNSVLEEFLNGKINRLYQDTSNHISKIPTHCNIEWLEDRIPIDKRARVFCMHLEKNSELLFQEKGFSTVEVSKQKFNGE